MSAFTIQLSAQQDCDCPMEIDLVCASDTLGNYIEFPNACWAECLGFTVVSDSTLCDAGNPWGDCGCTVTDSTFVCAEDSLGNIFPVPNTCLAACWGLTVVEGTDCGFNPWDDCECPEIYDPVCAVDVVGNYLEFSNACYAECYGFTIVTDSTLCSFDPWDDCNCTQEYAPVCAVDSIGNYVEFSNACYAACYGYEVVADSTLCGINPWGDCNCTFEYAPVCAVDSSGYYLEFSNACFAACWGFEVVTDSTLCDFVDPWDDCNCTQEYEPVCAQDSLGNYAEFPNACYAACFGFTVVTDPALCDYNPWGDCACEIDPNEPFVCAVDSIGHPCYVPNACFAACWGLTVTGDSICTEVDIDPEIDWEVMGCIDSLSIDENTTFQQALLLISESCGLALPECILDAPIFDTDTAFIMYIVENCDGEFGFNGNTSGSNVMNLYNFINNSVLTSTDNTDVFDTRLSLIANPISQQLDYQVTTSTASDIAITLMDINGQRIFRDQISIGEGKYTYTKDISQLNSGIYLLNLASGKSYQTVKVVITK